MESVPDFKESSKRFDRLLSRGADELTIILKGHLLIEEQLRAIVRGSFSNPEYFDQSRIAFSNLLLLARAVAGHLNQGACWVACEKLNAVRNQLSHQAEPKPYSALLEDFFGVCEADDKSDKIRALPRGKVKLRAYIGYIWGTFTALNDVVHIFIKLNTHPVVLKGASTAKARKKSGAQQAPKKKKL